MRVLLLGECCDIVSGATPKSSVPEFWGGDIAWATPADLSEIAGAYIETTPRTLTAAGLASCSAKVLPPDSVLFSSRAPIGHVAISKVPMATNQGFKSLIPKSGILDAKYLYQWLKANKTYLQSLGNGATFKEVSKTTVARVEIPVPAIEEQRRIATILDQVDDLCAKRSQILALLDDLASSLFMEMVEGIGPSAWQPFGDVCQRVTVGVVIKPASHYVTHGIPALRTLNVKPGRLDLSDLVYFSPSSNDGPLAKSKLRAGDLVIARTGRPGTAAAIPSELDGANAVDLIVATPDRRRALPEYLEGLMNSVLGKRIVAGEQRGQIQQHFNVGSLNTAMVPIPPIEAQRRLAERLSEVKAQKRRLEQHAYVLTDLLKCARGRLLTGQMAVSA